MDCAICLEPITLSTGSATLSCQHAYHLGCIMTSIDAGHYKCPCCRTALKATELPQHIIAEREEDAAEVAVTLSQPGQVTEEMINNLYAETLAPYVWHRVANGNRCHYAAWSSVYTSMLTLQAAARGFLTRRRLRVAPAPAPAS